MAFIGFCIMHNQSADTCECNDLWLEENMAAIPLDDVAHFSEYEYQRYHRMKAHHAYWQELRKRLTMETK